MIPYRGDGGSELIEAVAKGVARAGAEQVINVTTKPAIVTSRGGVSCLGILALACILPTVAGIAYSLLDRTGDGVKSVVFLPGQANATSVFSNLEATMTAVPIQQTIDAQDVKNGFATAVLDRFVDQNHATKVALENQANGTRIAMGLPPVLETPAPPQPVEEIKPTPSNLASAIESDETSKQGMFQLADGTNGSYRLIGTTHNSDANFLRRCASALRNDSQVRSAVRDFGGELTISMVESAAEGVRFVGDTSRDVILCVDKDSQGQATYKIDLIR